MKESYSGREITILGLGRYEHGSGIAAVKFFIDQGANLLITDLQTEEDLAVQIERVKTYAEEANYNGTITWMMGEHNLDEILKTDLVVANQAIPITSDMLTKIRLAGIPIEAEITLFFKNCPAPIVGITGTRGKSTTSSLIAHILQGGKRKVHLGGNTTDMAALELLDDVKADDLVILELSNFMLEYLNEQKLSPHTAVLLNVLPDHLSRYGGSMDDYAAVKEAITSHQTENDILIVNQQNTYTHKIGERSSARVVWYDITDDEQRINLDVTALVGQHNREHVLAAATSALELGMSAKQVEENLGSFRPLQGRLQFIDDVNGVTYINDTTSTTPAAAVAAIEALRDRPLILIAGGSDKELDFSEFVQELSQVKALVWLPGKGTDRIKSLISGSASYEQIEANTMKEAVRLASSRSESGDMVVLSPACASFGLFKNEFDRGDQFNDEVAKLK